MSFDTEQKIRNFAQLFDKLIQDSGMTKRQVALKLDVSPSAITYYTLGTRIPKAETMLKISQLFHIPVSDLIGINFEERSRPAFKIEQISSEVGPVVVERVQTALSSKQNRKKLMRICMELSDDDVEFAIELLENIKNGNT